MRNKIKLLIVDDNLDDIYIIRELLKDITIIQCEHEKSLNQTLKLLEKEKFDCILLDLNLPDSLGTDTLKDVLDQHPELPIVVLTIIDDEDTAIKSLQEGAQDYLVKGKINGEIISRSVRYAIERKKVENGLRESEKKYRNIANTILEGLWITDAEGKTTYINKQLAKMLYYTEEEILNKPFFDFVDKSLQHESKQFFERRKQGIIDRYDFRFIKKDGSTLWVTVSASPIFDKKGKFAGAMGLLTDITNRKLMEQSLERSVQEWNSTFNAIADIICIIDLDGKITHCNDAAYGLFKKSNKEIIGKTCWEILNCPSDRLKNCPIINMQKSHKRETLTLQINDKWFHSTVDPIVDNKGDIIGGVHTISDITKYKLSQDALKESELALKKSQQIAHTGHWTWDIETNKLIWSEEMFNIFGITKDQFDKLESDLDKIIDKTVYPDDKEKFRELNKKVKLEGYTTPLEYRIVWPNDTIHTVWMEPGEKIINGSGDITKLFVTIQDITERKQIEEKLRKNEENLKRAQRVAHVGNWEWDLITGKITWSEEVFHLYGIDPKQQEPTYKELLKYCHPEDIPNFERVVEDAVKNGTPYIVMCRAILPNGSTRCLEGRGEAVRDNKGNIIKLFGTSMDVTEHVHVQSLLNETQRITKVGGWEYDVEKKMTTWTDEVYDIYGVSKDYDPNNINPNNINPNNTYQNVEFYSYDDKLIIKNAFDNAVNHGKPYDLELKFVSAKGQHLWIRTIGKPIMYDENVVRIVGNIMDITERKNEEKKLNKACENLKRSNKELEQFAYVASHDLQEPLRTIYGFVELLAENYKDKLDSDAGEYIEFITTGARRMQQMIDDLLALSRITTKGKEFAPTNIERILKIVLENLRSLIDKSQVIITYDTIPTIIADDSQIIQLFQNLIENAIKFRREETPKIHISSKRQDGYWLFSVKDNGIGIDKNQFKKLFVIFQRLHNREKYPGTGIGLAMCKKIVERHEGRIWVESEVGIGSTFYFTIPLRPTGDNIVLKTAKAVSQAQI